MTPEDPLQTTFDDHRSPLLKIREALEFYAKHSSYRPILLGRPKRPILRDRGCRAREAIATLEQLVDLDTTKQHTRRTS